MSLSTAVPTTYVPDDDYPGYVMRAAHAVVGNPGSLGIVIGGSGNGEQIASNKIPGIRAALAWTTETAQLARQHDDANVLSLGARMYSDEDALEFAKVFVATPFSQEPRHARRLAMIADFEKSGELPAARAGVAARRTLACPRPSPAAAARLRLLGCRVAPCGARFLARGTRFFPDGCLGQLLRPGPRHVPGPHGSAQRDLHAHHGL